MSEKQLKLSLKIWERRKKFRWNKVRFYEHKSKRSKADRERLALKWRKLAYVADTNVTHRKHQLEAIKPLRLKALDQMQKLVGIMEYGGNNQGKEVMEIIRANSGTGPEPWCGDTVAFAYRKAGSKAVTRAWAAVVNLGFLAGMKRVGSPLPGDIVTYKFDHTGMFVKWLDANTFLAIEGNTGTSGAVSDSKTGGDGVYEKKRSKDLVSRWVRVTR